MSFEVKHPLRDDTIATVEMTFGSDDPQMEEFVVEIGWNESEQGTDIGWQLIVRVHFHRSPCSGMGCVRVDVLTDH